MTISSASLQVVKAFVTKNLNTLLIYMQHSDRFIPMLVQMSEHLWFNKKTWLTSWTLQPRVRWRESDSGCWHNSTWFYGNLRCLCPAMHGQGRFPLLKILMEHLEALLWMKCGAIYKFYIKVSLNYVEFNGYVPINFLKGGAIFKKLCKWFYINFFLKTLLGVQDIHIKLIGLPLI